MKGKKLILGIVVVALIAVIIFILTNGTAPSTNTPGNGNGSDGPSNPIDPGYDPTHTHEWVESNKEEATCTTNGRIYYYCSIANCTETYEEEITATGHNKEIIPGYAPTCYEFGLSDGESCSKCGMIFVNQEPIQHADHVFIDNVCINCGTDYHTPSSSFTLNEDGDGYTFDNYQGETDLVVPDEYNGLPVTKLDLDIEDNYYTLESIVIGNNITEIPAQAFRGFQKLKTVVLGENIKVIGEKAFENCELLENITFPDGLIEIQDFAFSNCKSFTEIVLPDSLNKIGMHAFADCINVTNVNTGNGVSVINSCAFSFLFNLEVITFGDNVKYVEYENFDYYTKIRKIIVPDGIEYFNVSYNDDIFNTLQINEYNDGYYLGNYNTKHIVLLKTENIISSTYSFPITCKVVLKITSNENLKSIKFEGNITHLGRYSIQRIEDLEKVTLGNKIKYIDEDFSNDGVTSLTIPASVIQIKTTSFRYLETLVVDGLNSVYDSRNNCNAIIEKATNKLVAGCSKSKIPNTVVTIGERAFFSTNLTGITIPSSVRVIEQEAFADNPFSNITIPEGVTSIGVRAFYLTEIKNLTIPNSVTEISHDAFNSCYFLKTVVIGKGLKNIEYGTFSNCNSLKSVTFGDSVERIESDAFGYCDSLTSITIPSSVTLIEPLAFRGCDSLTTVTVDENNPVYDSRENCNAIIETETNKLIHGFVSTKILDSIESIGQEAFSSINLESIYIPKSVKSIWVVAFYECNLEKIYYEGSQEDWEEIYKDEPITLDTYEIIFNYTLNEE